MENIINLNELEQSNSNFQSFILSKNFTVYKTIFKNEFSKEELIKKIKINNSLNTVKGVRNNHSIEISIECPEFKYIDDFFIKSIKEIDNCNTDKISKYSWVYIQDKKFSINWMDNHKDLHRFNKSKITTQWVCVLYVQIPTDMENGEGNLVFKTENNDLYSFTPKENDLLIFSGLLDHMTIPNQNSNTERISFVSNFSFDLLNGI